MTDNEIIKFIEHAINSAKSEDGFKEIYWKKLDYILDLINRQKAENERLNDSVLANAEAVKVLTKELKTAKSEAIKEFAERLTDKADLIKVNPFDSKWAISQDNIDNLVKEMTE